MSQETPQVDGAAAAGTRVEAPVAIVDLHCHTRASFDSLAEPAAVVRAAARRGLTHLAVTDHNRIEGALEALDAAPANLQIIPGEEVKSADGDMIAVFLRGWIPPGLSAVETIAAVREQGGLIGIPHPFDRFRGFGRHGTDLEAVADAIDWVEAYNARAVGRRANERAALFAHDHGLPGLAASDAHTVVEVGVASNVLFGDPSTPQGLLAALSTVEIRPGRAAYYVRAATPLARIVKWLRREPRPSAART